MFNLPYPCQPEQVKQTISLHRPHRIIAVGGDGTLKLVVESTIDMKVPLGILPIKLIDLIRINDQLCIYLGDIGFNAFVVKTFETFDARGMWGYIKAAWKVLWRNRCMQVSISTDNESVRRDAAMEVLANASKYGTGAVVDPEGSLDDGLFEVIVMKRVALSFSRLLH